MYTLICTYIHTYVHTGKLLVGAAVKANGNSDEQIERIKALHTAGCNIIILDAQNGDNLQQVELIKIVKRDFPTLDVIAGNIVRVSQAKLLLEAGADGLRIGKNWFVYILKS